MTDREWHTWMLEDTLGIDEARQRVEASYLPGGATIEAEPDDVALDFFYGLQEEQIAATGGDAPEGMIIGDEAFIRASELAYGAGHVAVGQETVAPPLAA